MNTENILEAKLLALEENLRQTNNDLAKCKKQTEDFIQIASHDLHAPLRKLSTFIERLTSKCSDILGEEALLYVTRIENTITGMRSLIDDLTALSEITEADIHLNKCDLNEVVQAVLRDMAILIKQNNATIKFSPLPVIEASAERLKTAFKLIISNAIKFKKEGADPEISINCESLSTEEKEIHNLKVEITYYQIEFSDNGIGFKPEYAARIMEPFQRLHGKSAYSGNGLGLAVCKKIIEKHEGKIYATPNENSGARFILILPSTHNY